ncbi:MAG: hypothetical protein AAF391_11535 [Bacteroidota bacterium]
MSDKIDKWIDEALKTEPAFKLRGDFRDRVVETIRKKEQRNQKSFYFWMILGILSICAFGYGVVVFFTPTLFEGLGDMSKIMPIAIVVGIVMALIQFLDKKLVKERMITPQM